MEHVLYVGIDVDDKSFHGAGMSLETGEVLEFACKPTNEGILRKLRKLEEKGFALKICYEATYLGFSLQRFLAQKDIACDVVAPSLIPEVSGHRVKNDRLDSLKLARYYGQGLLTVVHVPSPEQEQDRDLIRSRRFIVDQRSALKTHILFMCRRLGWNYKQGNAQKGYWTQMHEQWLAKKIKGVMGMAKENLEFLLEQLQSLNALIERYDTQIEALSHSAQYKKGSQALCCMRGLSTLSAMSLMTELGDIHRFSHPRQLTSYAGLDVKEYSSGGKERRYGITKMGNRRIRTTAVEACQLASRPIKISKRLKQARKDQPAEVIAIANRCMRRLHQKSQRMLASGKHRNKAKTACGRELLNFTWEMLRAVA